MLEAIPRCGADEVMVLPNDPDSVRAAEMRPARAEEEGESGSR